MHISDQISFMEASCQSAVFLGGHVLFFCLFRFFFFISCDLLPSVYQKVDSLQFFFKPFLADSSKSLPGREEKMVKGKACLINMEMVMKNSSLGAAMEAIGSRRAGGAGNSLRRSSVKQLICKPPRANGEGNTASECMAKGRQREWMVYTGLDSQGTGKSTLESCV